MGDGRLNFCKQCVRRRVSAHRLRNVEAARAYDRRRAKEPARIRATAAATKRRRRANPAMLRAHNAVARAIASGAIKRRPCEVCGRRDSVAHHEDYAKPLIVRWLCYVHHAARHRELGTF